jgi:hypothetical protein
MLYYDSTGNLAVPSAIVGEAGSDLESACEAYASDFGRSPRLTPDPINVLFSNELTFQTRYNKVNDLATVDLPAAVMRQYEPNRLRRQSAAYHEVFHLLQAAFGIGFDEELKWFTEGTATWAEAAYCKAVNGLYLLAKYFEGDCSKNITQGPYINIPYWIFLENIAYNTKRLTWFMADILNTYATLSEPRTLERAIDLTIRNQVNPGGLPWSLVQFGMEAAVGSWFLTPEGSSVNMAIGPLYDSAEYPTKKVNFPKTWEFSSNHQHQFSEPDEWIPLIESVAAFSITIFKITVSTGTNLDIRASVGGIMSPNDYYGPVVFLTATNQPIGGRDSLEPIVSHDKRSWTSQGDSQGIYLVFAGSHDQPTRFDVRARTVLQQF